SRMHSLPQAPTSFAKRSLNDPLTSDSARWRTPLRTAISMNPVADVVPTRTVREVRNSLASGCSSPWSSRSLALERSPVIVRRLVAHIGGDAVEHDVFGVEQVQHSRHVLVGKHVEPMFVEENVAPMTAQAIAERLRVAARGLDDERVAQRGLGDLLLARRPSQ